MAGSGEPDDIDVGALVDGASARALAGAKRPGGGSGLWQWAAVGTVGGGDGSARSGTPTPMFVGERDIDGWGEISLEIDEDDGVEMAERSPGSHEVHVEMPATPNGTAGDFVKLDRESAAEVVRLSREAWGADPRLFKCPYCKAGEDYSANSLQHTPFVWAGVGLLCLVGCWLGCCLAPLCLDAQKDAYHRCTRCRKVVGVRRSGRCCRCGDAAWCCFGSDPYLQYVADVEARTAVQLPHAPHAVHTLPPAATHAVHTHPPSFVV
ncbi:hypothetical protein T484DRAFT_1886759 [Baffinella frigidus]|nr:hypothetical protein T484DRAFT_1886759 [Cryptophyta sp. CCMP2293]